MIAVKWRYFDDGRACRPKRVDNPGSPTEWVVWEAEEWSAQASSKVWAPCDTPPPPENWFRLTENGLSAVVSLFADDGIGSPDDTGASGSGPVRRVLRVPIESRTGRLLTADELAADAEFQIGVEAETVRREVMLARELKSGRWKPAAVEAARGSARKLPKCQKCGPDHIHSDGE